jgi:hypothetical protein
MKLCIQFNWLVQPCVRLGFININNIIMIILSSAVFLKKEVPGCKEYPKFCRTGGRKKGSDLHPSEKELLEWCSSAFRHKIPLFLSIIILFSF